MTSWPTDFAETTGFDLLDEPLADDVRKSVNSAIKYDAIFEAEPNPSSIFRQVLLSSIRQLKEDQHRFDLFVRFLRDGPHDAPGPIPLDISPQRLTDDETGQAIRYIFHRVINTFQGALAELLAVGPCVSLFRELQADGKLPSDCQVYVGDMTLLKARGSARMVKGPDVLALKQIGSGGCQFVGIAEVKSYPLSQRRLEKQIYSQLVRAKRGVHFYQQSGDYEEFSVSSLRDASPIKIGVVPASWRLSREFHFETRHGKRKLILDPIQAPQIENRIAQVGSNSWRVTLRWSREALASAAYEMTFWLMGEIGRAIYGEKRPPEWSEMTSEEAGRNAAKMMLYYAILRSRNAKEARPAVALYNAYSFGYALGTSFKDAKGRREMLWPEDLDEIAETGFSKEGCFLHR